LLFDSNMSFIYHVEMDASKIPKPSVDNTNPIGSKIFKIPPYFVNGRIMQQKLNINNKEFKILTIFPAPTGIPNNILNQKLSVDDSPHYGNQIWISNEKLPAFSLPANNNSETREELVQQLMVITSKLALCDSMKQQKQ